MRFRYFDPAEQATVEGRVHSTDEVAELVSMIRTLGGAESPAVEFAGHDGSSVVLGIAGERAALLCTDASGITSHSVAASAADLEAAIVFDYFGAYTELPASYVIRTRDAVRVVGDYVGSGAVVGLVLATD